MSLSARARTARILAALTAMAGAACEGNQSMFNPKSGAADSIANLGWLLFGVGGIVYLTVMAALAWALIRKRRPDDDLPETTRRLGKVIAVGVAVTTIVLVSLTASSAWVARGLGAPAGAGAIHITVVGHQWWWDFQYRYPTASSLLSSPNELRIPVSVPVVLAVQSRDVIHSFWVPNLHGKRDLIPGETTHLLIQADEPGVYRGQCAEFCGHQHARMAFTVVAEPMDRFQAWVAQLQTPAPEPASDQERRGRDLFMRSTCVTCHTIAGTTAQARVGPELTHLASRLTIAAGTLPNTREHLRAWVHDPPALRPGVRMPASPFTDDELDAVIAYLRSLR